MLNQKPIAVFFTHGVSLELWEKRGMLSREVRFYEALAEALGSEVCFFTYGKNDRRYQDRMSNRIKIFPKRLSLPNLLYGFILPFVYWHEIRESRFIRIHQMAGAIPVLIAHWILRKPLLVRCGYQWSIFLQKERAFYAKQFFISLIERVAYQSARVIIVTTDDDAAYIQARYSVPQKKIYVISNYVDTDLFKPIEVAKEKNSVCFVGRLEPEKNLLNLIEAAHETKIHLIFYGVGSLKDELRQKADRLGVRLSLRGKLSNDQLPQALNTCEIFILSSWHEGNPKALLEAMACGLPVIGTNVEGIRSVIHHDVNGILCETNPESIKNALLDLLSNQEKQKRLGAAAKETILANSSLKKTMESEYKIIGDIN